MPLRLQIKLRRKKLPSNINWKFINARQINRWSTRINRLCRKCIRAWRKRTLQDRPSRQPLPWGEPVIINIIPQRRSSRASDLCRPLSVRVRYKMHGWTEGQRHQKLPSFSVRSLYVQTRPTPRRALSSVDSLYLLDHNFELMDVPTSLFWDTEFK